MGFSVTDFTPGMKVVSYSTISLTMIFTTFFFQLRTHLGKPIYQKPGETAEELAERVREALDKLIQENQKLPGNILRALLARVYENPKRD